MGREVLRSKEMGREEKRRQVMTSEVSGSREETSRGS